ncbi:MRG-domain-containing protein [Piedraia hortae CBS 480.64]|uniref:Chromatin modification-related protein EAF3 n=1 Tax=Piedraia hortae CBS 480.64 TaxID=1314780 RepID=A0A6A7C560_9PEZI|nr:MRG-domain-containing protein [Piedraia hortae CBS 480.64]
MPPAPMYAKDEKVLCFHLELLYEAKVLEHKYKDPSDKSQGHLYRVHYKGWKNTWDDWVPTERLRKFTDENKELAANLKKDMEAQRKATNKSAASSGRKRHGAALDVSSARGSEDRSSAAPAAPSRKRGRDTMEGIDKEDDFIRRPAVRLFMPDPLKSILVDDWEKVTKDHRLVVVPSPTPAIQFLRDYKASESPNRLRGSAEEDILNEVVSGVEEYFNKALGRILLYRFERQQYHSVYKQITAGHGEHAGKSLAEMYGCEHLLRLLVSMPDLIAHTNMDAQSVSRLREELTKMVSWMARRIDVYLSHPYNHPGSEYGEG